MIDVKSGFRSVAARERWAGRGASFVAKAKATTAVWFPPEPTNTCKRSAATAKKATKKTAGKATAAARKSTGGKARVTKRAPSKKA